MRRRKSWLCFLLTAALCLSMAAPAFAAENTITFVLKNTSGQTVKTVPAYQGDATEYGPDQDAQVRSTYYDSDTKTVYDLDAGQEVSGALSGDKVFTYTQYTEASSAAGDSGSTGKTTSDTTQASYNVVVRYVDEAGKVISTRTITMNGRNHEFYGPLVFSHTEGNKTTYYTAVGSNKVTFTWNDKTTLTQDIVYQKVDTAQSGVTWTIYYMNAETGDTLGSVTQNVAPGETATKALNDTMQFDGAVYHLNAFYKSGEISYTYGKGTPISYVYYDPDGYDTSEKTRSITIEYRNIADGSVVKTAAVEVSSYATGDTEVDLDTNFEQNGVTWVLAKGQKTPLAVSYFSPKDTYQVYVRDVNDTANENTIVVYEDVVENGGTITNTVTNRVVTGTTTAIAWNTVTGATRTLGTFGVNGQQLAGGQNSPVYANNNNNNSTNSTNANGGTDVSEDGVALSRDAAPQASAAGQSNGSLTAAIAVAAGVGALALLLLLIILFRRKKRQDA